MTQPDPFADLNKLREAQIAEYGRYVAKDTIYINGARAYNAGDSVPVSAVDSGAVGSDQVVGTKTKTAAVLTTEKG